MVFKEFIDSSELRLEPVYGRREGRAIALRVLQHFCKVSSYEHIVNPNGLIDNDCAVKMGNALAELVSARPLQYVLGFEEFYGRKFFVEDGILIPRPETEELVRWVLEDTISGKLKNSGDSVKLSDNIGFIGNKDNMFKCRILDAACGSGCIGITLACEIAGSEVFALDFSDKAIMVTHINAAELIGNGANRLTERNHFSKNTSDFSALSFPLIFSVFNGDLLAGPLCQNIIEKHSLDIIVSNPPYIRESERSKMMKNVLDFEPAEALFVPDHDPLIFYKALAVWGLKLLKPGGSIYLEINESFGKEVINLFISSGYTNVVLRKDLSGKERMVRARIGDAP